MGHKGDTNPYEADKSTGARATLVSGSTFWYHRLRLDTFVKAHVRLVTFAAEDPGNEGSVAGGDMFPFVSQELRGLVWRKAPVPLAWRLP